MFHSIFRFRFLLQIMITTVTNARYDYELVRLITARTLWLIVNILYLFMLLPVITFLAIFVRVHSLLSELTALTSHAFFFQDDLAVCCTVNCDRGTFTIRRLHRDSLINPGSWLNVSVRATFVCKCTCKACQQFSFSWDKPCFTYVCLCVLLASMTI